MWFVDWTARNDWASTLNPDNSSFFYPSISSSVVLTDVIPELQSDVLSFIKLRGSWAQAGNSGDPYNIFGTYSLENQTYVGNALAFYTNQLPFLDLKNELTTFVEYGMDVRLLENWFGIDFTYYDAKTTNQIIPIDVPSSSGYSSRLTNAGELRNKGIELLLKGTPIQSDGGFSWDVTFNYAKNNSEVVELVEGVERFRLGVDRNVQVFAEPDQPFGQIWAQKFTWMRDEQGRRMVGPDGLPIKEEVSKPIGNAVPDWLGGLTNRISLRGFSVSALLDIRQGGDIFSMSNVYEAMHGTTKRTLEGRQGDLVVDGVKAIMENGAWVSTGETNDVATFAQDYWFNAALGSTQAVTEEFLNDASYISLREVNLGYNFPAKWFTNSVFKDLRLALTGRNLGYLQRNTEGFSPEASAFNVSSNALGLESASFPMTRTFGINLNVTF